MNSISFISSGFSESSVIREKNLYLAKSIDHHPELIQQLFETGKIEKSRNIFQDPVNLKIVQHDPAIGPRYEKNKIVTRSIVGKPEIFKKKGDVHPQIAQSPADLKLIIAKHESPLQRRLSALKVTQSPIKVSSKKLVDKTIAGQELMNKITQLESRLIQSKLDDQKQYDHLSFENRQTNYKDQRALEDFEKQEKLQTELMYSLSHRINRDPSMSLMMDLYKFRRKQEYSTTNDRMRLISEYRNQKIIQIAEENQVPFFLSSDRQEIIRKPYNVLKDETSKSIIRHLNEDKAFSSSTTNLILREKQRKYQHLVVDKISTNLEDLMVKGHSKYESEMASNHLGRFVFKDIERGNQQEEYL